jgi:hypothetical protein
VVAGTPTKKLAERAVGYLATVKFVTAKSQEDALLALERTAEKALLDYDEPIARKPALLRALKRRFPEYFSPKSWLPKRTTTTLRRRRM